MRKYTVDEGKLVNDHLAHYRDAAISAIDRLKRTPNIDAYPGFKGQLEYWKHVIAALEWAEVNISLCTSSKAARYGKADSNTSGVSGAGSNKLRRKAIITWP